jgi:hypothetical protein
MALTKYSPQAVKQFSLYKQWNRKRRQWAFRKQLSTAKPLRVILGAGPTNFPGWVQTDKELLDVSCPEDW